jgi:hemerythrin-like domain-containing protein
MPNAFEMLHEDHERVAKILKDIERTGAHEVDERRALVALVEEELEIHAHFEEAEVYPAIQKALGEEDGLGHAVQEHAEAMKLVLALSASVDEGGDAWKEILKELTAAVEHHVEQEENELFPKARKAVPEQEIKNLEKSYKKLKETVAV